jgi:putative flippase GtrA
MTTWHLQGLRFIVVGLGSNFVLYLLYLFLTTAGLGHKAAMSLLFAVGTLQTFLFNKRWTFARRGFLQASFVKYVTAYTAAYLLNLAALFIFVDRFGFAHQFVQGAMILSLALMLFLLQKFWVFRAPATAPTRA